MFSSRAQVIWLCFSILIVVVSSEEWWMHLVKRIMAERRNSAPHPTQSINTTDLSAWMTNLPDKLHNVPLNKLAIPGSHDSGAFWLNLNWPVVPSESGLVKDLGKYRSVRQIIKKWSLTQGYNVGVQLERGVRYIDMRTVYHKQKDDFFVYHGLYGSKSTLIFQQIRDFIDKHPKEVVLIDFNHLVQFTPKVSVRFKNLIMTYFGDKLFAKNSQGFNITLNDVWTAGKQIIAFYRTPSPSSSSTKFWLLSSVHSKWFNTTSLRYLLHKLSQLLMTSSHDDGDKFTVFQGVLSPSTWTILFHSSSSLKRHFALKCNRGIGRWLDGLHKRRTTGINIVITDFVTYNNMPARVIRMNDLLL